MALLEWWLDWIKDFLSGRTWRVVLEGHSSDDVFSVSHKAASWAPVVFDIHQQPTELCFHLHYSTIC